MATETDIEVIQGATFNLSMTWTTDDQVPVPISLSGYRAHMQIRSKAGAVGTPWADATSSNGQIILEPGSVTGAIAVRIPATVTATLKKDGWYDLFVIASADATEATRLLAGKVTLAKSTTIESVG
jgi:hypothetical protein